jgi:4-amino-4-deoxy-L-arabinose transferase-like glycosyltransferase
MALALKLGLPAWTAPLACSALAVGVLYLVLTELIDGAAGCLGAIMLLSARLFRRVSVAYLSQSLALLLVLLSIRAYLKWRAKRSAARAALVGAFVGALAITRPMEAACLGTLLLVAACFDLRHIGARRGIALITAAAAACLPFVIIQLACNRAITGQWTTLPWVYYAHRDDPYDNQSFRPLDRNVQIVSDLPQKRVIQEEQTFEAYEQKVSLRFDRRFLEIVLPDALKEALPFAPLLALIPIGLCALDDRRRWILWAFLPLWVFAYTFHTFVTSHYVVTAAPAVILATLLGVHALAGARRGWQNPTWLVAALLVLAVSLTGLPEFQKNPPGDTILRPIEATRIDRQLAGLRPPCVVLFRFSPGCDALAEPVYNIDVAWPDDAPIIRAHDKGEAANQRIFRYYAKRSPDRAFYLFDRAAAAADKDGLHYIGTARELAK